MRKILEVTVTIITILSLAVLVYDSTFYVKPVQETDASVDVAAPPVVKATENAAGQTAAALTADISLPTKIGTFVSSVISFIGIKRKNK